MKKKLHAFLKYNMKTIWLSLLGLMLLLGTTNVFAATTVTLGTSNPAVAAANICPGATKVPIYRFTETLSGSPGKTLTGFFFSTNAGYLDADIVKFQLWSNTVNNLSTATLSAGGDITTTLGPGVHTFPGAFSFTLTASATTYFWVTMDVAATATAGNTITVPVITIANTTTSQADVAGSISAGGAQTIAALPTPVTVATSGTYCVSTTLTASGGTGGTIYWQNTTSGGTSTATPSSSQLVSATNTYYFRAQTALGCWSVEGSADVTINTVSVGGTVTGGTTPICYGSANGTLTLSGHTGIVIRWEKRVDAGSWTSVYNTSTTFSEVPSSAGTWDYRAVVQNGVCAEAYSNSVTIVVNSLPADPADPTYSAPSCSTTFTVSATGSAPAGETWYWQGTSCGTSTAMGSAPSTYAALSAGTYYIRARNNATGCWSNGCGYVVIVADQPAVVTNPEAVVYGCNGTPLTFSIVTTGAGLTYQWEEFNGSWLPLSNGGVYSGVTTEVLTISNPAGLSGRQYRCVVTGNCAPPATSTAATLTVLASGLSGVKNIPGDYATLKAAFDDINAKGLIGNLELKIGANITETAEASLIQWNNCGNTGYTVTIYPTGATRTVSGTIATSLITLNGADNVTFDGRIDKTGAANSLIISNTNVAGSSIKFINDATYNTVQYCTVQGVSNVATTGVLWFSTATTTGNDNNTISYCDIKDGATTPTVCVFAEGTAGKENSMNTISNCNIYNFWKTSASAFGIYVKTGNSKWIISGNSVYQTASRQNSDFMGIVVQNPDGSEFTIENNYVGGQAAGCTGSALTYSYSTYPPWFRGIFLVCNTSGLSYIRNNYVKNINFTGAPAAAPDNIFVPILGATGRIDITGNTVGDDGAGTSITLTINANGATNYPLNIGIYKTGDGNMLNNSIGSITFNGTLTKTNIFYGYYISGTILTDAIISGNTLGHATTANSITTLSSATQTPVNLVGFLFGTAGNYVTTVSNNTIANISLNGTGSLPLFRGINNQASGGTQRIINNSIYNISNACTNTTECLMGIINFSSSTGSNLIYQNIIHSLSSTGAAAVTVEGLWNQVSTTGNTNIYNNFVHSLSSTYAGSTIRGITLADGPTSIYNNMVRLGVKSDGTSLNTAALIYGIYKSNSDATNIYFNSIYIGGANTGVAASTYALRRVTSGTEVWKNNIFYNARSGAGTHYSVLLAATTSLTSNYNDLYAPSASGCISNAGGGCTFVNWQALGFDANGKNVDPSFTAQNGTSSTVDLHLLNDASPVIAMGTPISGISVDYDNQSRDNPPCIGADERVIPPLAKNAYGIYMPEAQTSGTIADCEIFATGGTPGGIGYLVANPTSTNYANVGISGYQVITAQNISCLNTNIDFTTTDGTPDWLMGNGSSPTTGSTSPLYDIQYTTLGRKDILESVKIFKDFINMTMEKPDAGTILGAPSGAGCPTTYTYTSSVAGSPGYTYSWSCVVPLGCTATVVTPDASSTDITFVNLTGVNQVFLVQLQITTECCGPLDLVQRYITIYPAPVAPTAASPFSLCTGGSQIISVTSPDPAYAYAWYDAETGGTLLGSGTSYTISSVLSGATTYYVEAVNSFGCASARTPVVVTGVDTPAPTVPDADACGAGNVTLTVSSPGAGYTYNWYSGSCSGTVLQSGTSTSFTTYVTSTTTIYVNAIPPECGASTCSAPVITFTTPPDPIVWLGITAGPNNWFTASNWGGCMPTCATNVRIPITANNPDIGFDVSGNAACKNINLEVGAALSFSDSKAELDVCGDFTHSGTITTNNNGQVVFMGTTDQLYSKLTGTGDFYNVVLNNTDPTPTLTLSTSNGDMIVGNAGSFTFRSGKVITLTDNRLSITNPSTTAVSGHDVDKYVVGNLKRYLNTSGSYDFPVGNIDSYQLANFDFTSNSINYLDVRFDNPTDAFGTGLPLSEGLANYVVIRDNGSPGGYGGVWTVAPDAALPANYAVTLNGRYFSAASYLGNTVVKRESAGPGAWTLPGTFTFDISSSTLISVKRSGISGFSDFAIASSATTLPVELISFSAVCINEKINVSWSTASEINNDYFTVEKSKDLNNWETVSIVPSNGSSNVVHSYNSIDHMPYSGLSYYRLKQTDFDGAFKHFSPVQVNCDDSQKYGFDISTVSLQNDNELVITFTYPSDGDNYYFALFDDKGHLIQQQNNKTVNGLNQIVINYAEFAHGIYLFTLSNSTKLISKKFILH